MTSQVWLDQPMSTHYQVVLLLVRCSLYRCEILAKKLSILISEKSLKLFKRFISYLRCNGTLGRYDNLPANECDRYIEIGSFVILLEVENRFRMVNMALRMVKKIPKVQNKIVATQRV